MYCILVYNTQISRLVPVYYYRYWLFHHFISKRKKSKSWKRSKMTSVATILTGLIYCSLLSNYLFFFSTFHYDVIWNCILSVAIRSYLRQIMCHNFEWLVNKIKTTFITLLLVHPFRLLNACFYSIDWF